MTICGVDNWCVSWCSLLRGAMARISVDAIAIWTRLRDDTTTRDSLQAEPWDDHHSVLHSTFELQKPFIPKSLHIAASHSISSIILGRLLA